MVQILENEDPHFLTAKRLALMEKDAMSLRNKVGSAILFVLKLRDPESGMLVFRKNVLDEAKLG